MSSNIRKNCKFCEDAKQRAEHIGLICRILTQFNMDWDRSVQGIITTVSNNANDAIQLHIHFIDVQQLKVKSLKFAQIRFYKSKFILTCSILAIPDPIVAVVSGPTSFHLWRIASLDVVIISFVVVYLFVCRFQIAHYTTSLHQKCVHVHTLSLFINGMASRNAHKRLHTSHVLIVSSVIHC